MLPVRPVGPRTNLSPVTQAEAEAEAQAEDQARVFVSDPLTLLLLVFTCIKCFLHCPPAQSLLLPWAPFNPPSASLSFSHSFLPFAFVRLFGQALCAFTSCHSNLKMLMSVLCVVVPHTLPLSLSLFVYAALCARFFGN